MERVGRRRRIEGSTPIELLAGVSELPHEPRPERRHLWSTTAILGVVGALLVLFLWWLPNAGGPPQGRLHEVETRFGDPFALDWVVLEGPGDASAPYARPRPMASLDQSCVGFGRLDWPEADRHPSVAHCLEPDAVAALRGGGIAVVRDVVAGADTWYLLLFGGDIDGLDVTIDDDSEVLGSERVYRTGPFAALLIPNGHTRVSLRWSLTSGNDYQCTFTAGPDVAVSATDGPTGSVSSSGRGSPAGKGPEASIAGKTCS